MKLVVGLVLRSLFQEVVSRSTGNKVNLLELSLLCWDSKFSLIKEDISIFKIWGTVAGDRLRHRIYRGSILVVDEKERKRSFVYGNEGVDLLYGSLVAFTEISSQKISIYEPHPSVHDDMEVISQISSMVTSFEIKLSSSPQWSIMRSCIANTKLKSDFAGIEKDTKSVLFAVDMSVCITSLFSKENCMVQDNEGSIAKLIFNDPEARNCCISRIISALQEFHEFVPIVQMLQQYINDASISVDTHAIEVLVDSITQSNPYLASQFFVVVASDASDCVPTHFLRLHFDGIAVHTSYQHRITSLRFFPQCTYVRRPNFVPAMVNAESKINDTFVLDKNEVENDSSDMKRAQTEGMPHQVDVTFFTWQELNRMLSSLKQSKYDSARIEDEHETSKNAAVYIEGGNILFCGFLQNVQFHGMKHETFHQNIACQSTPGIAMGQNIWMYKNATITISPIKKSFRNGSMVEFDVSKVEVQLRKTMYDRFVANPSGYLLGTQCPYSAHSLGSVHSSSIVSESCTHVRKVRTKDVIYAIIHHYLQKPDGSETRKVQAQQLTQVPTPKDLPISVNQYTREKRQYPSPPGSLQFLSSESLHVASRHHHSLLTAGNPISFPTKRKASWLEEEDDDTGLLQTNHQLHRVVHQRQFSQWRFSQPSLVPTPTRDARQPVSVAAASSATDDTSAESISLLVSHDYQQEQLFHGVSPVLIGLELYRERQKLQQHEAAADTTAAPPSYLNLCMEKLQKLEMMVESDKCMLFLCKILPTVDDDGEYTGDLILSLEDIL